MERMDMLDAMEAIGGRVVDRGGAGRADAVKAKATRFEVEIRAKRGVDWSVTDQSNWGLGFVFNKTS